MKHVLSLLWALALVGLTMATRGDPTRRQQNAARVPMESLRTLYFKDGHMTSSRRKKPFKQIACTGNSKHICETYGPDIAVCMNMDGGAWKCEADLHHSVRFGTVDVSCEGWDGPQDEFVLRGSCMLRYTLVPNYADKGYGIGSASPKSNKELYVFVAIIAIIFYFSFRRGRQEQAAGAAGGGPGGGGGGGGWGDGFWGRPGGFFGGGGAGGNDQPPPPYVPYPKTEPGATAQVQAGWRPGFWTGLAGGALGAGLMRNVNRGGSDTTAERRRRPFADSDYDPFDRGGGNAFGAAGPSRTGGDSGETRTAYGYGSSSVR